MVVGAHVILRPLDRRHLERTRTWANDLDLARLLDRARPVSDGEHERWFTALTQRDDCVFFAVESVAEERHVGNVWLWAMDSRHCKAEVRIVLGETACLGRGLGTEALQLISGYAFERLNLHRLYAYVRESGLPD
jgi:RimJ/RimL family protein N-acetyltransferase